MKKVVLSKRYDIIKVDLYMVIKGVRYEKMAGLTK